MTWLQVSITATQRVSLGQGGERAFLTTSHPVVPGSVIRGALAAAWVNAGGTRDAQFKALFEGARFSPAIPDGVTVVNQSLSVCKYHVPGAVGHEAEHDEAFLGRLGPDDHGCRGRAAANGGYRGVEFVTVTTTALEPRKHVAARSQLFSRQAFEAGTVFTGFVVVPDGVSHARLGKIRTVFLGGRSSVMGRCQLEAREVAPPALPADGQGNVVIRTVSPTILLDDAGAPTGDLAAVLTRGGLKVHSVWAGRRDANVASGWHAASGLPKPAEIAVAPGAMALLGPVDSQALLRLLEHGIGVRRNEGYGWVEIAPEPTAAAAPAATTQAPAHQAAESASRWLQTIRQLDLGVQERQWVADRLRHHPPGVDLSAQELKEPAIRRLSSPQLEGIMQVVSGVPADQRSSLAFMITRGGLA